MTKRMIIMLIAVGLVFGGVFGFQIFKNAMIRKFMSAMPQPPQTVSTVTAATQETRPADRHCRHHRRHGSNSGSRIARGGGHVLVI